jgi:AcrR family transcriptional regulator
MSTSGRALLGASTRRSSRHGLSREHIAQVALTFIEREGLDALSMRSLAEDLEIGTMTLYGYFRGKEELLDAVVDVTVEQLAIPNKRGSWRRQIGTLLQEIRTTLAEHPIGILLRHQRPMWSPGALRVSEAGVRILRDAGFSKADAARGYRTLFNYTFGFAAFSPADVSDELRQGALAALAALPRDQYPAQTEAASELAEAVGGEAQFQYGLDLLLDGMEARLRQAGETRIN